MKLIFLGAPGAGKGTQADKLCAEMGIAHISTGDMLRREMKAGTDLGLKAKAVMEAGGLVGDDIIIGMVKNRIAEADCANGFLLDGFPRTIAQADALGKLADIDMAVDIAVPAERLVARISGRRMCPDCGAAYHVSMYASDTCKCGGKLYQRDDDTAETVKNRLAVYKKQTQPLIDYYAGKGVLKSVDGDQAMDEVADAIRKALA